MRNMDEPASQDQRFFARVPRVSVAAVAAVIVASTDPREARLYGARGYNGGEPDASVELRRVVVTATNFVKSKELKRIAEEVGVPYASTYPADMLLRLPKVRSRLEEMGFDGYEANDVSRKEVRAVWKNDLVRVLPEDEPGLGSLAYDDGAFRIKITLAGVDALFDDISANGKTRAAGGFHGLLPRLAVPAGASLVRDDGTFVYVEADGTRRHVSIGNVPLHDSVVRAFAEGLAFP